MFAELFTAFVMEALDGRFLDRSVHAFDSSVGPRMLWLGQAVIDIVLVVGELEGVGAEDSTFGDGLFDFIDRPPPPGTVK